MRCSMPRQVVFRPRKSLTTIGQTSNRQLKLHKSLPKVGSEHFNIMFWVREWHVIDIYPEVLNFCGKIQSCITRETISWMVQQYCIYPLPGFHDAGYLQLLLLLIVYEHPASVKYGLNPVGATWSVITDRFTSVSLSLCSHYIHSFSKEILY